MCECRVENGHCWHVLAIAPHGRTPACGFSVLQEAVPWADVYRYLVSNGKVKPISCGDAYAKAKRGWESRARVYQLRVPICSGSS